MISNSMLNNYDCEIVALSYALDIDYHTVASALWPFGNPDWFIINPLRGNPWNVKRAIRKLGYQYEQISVEDIQPQDTIIMLIHLDSFSLWRHILYQHWICKKPNEDWNWGDGKKYYFTLDKLKEYSDCKLYRTILRIHKGD